MFCGGSYRGGTVLGEGQMSNIELVHSPVLPNQPVRVRHTAAATRLTRRPDVVQV